MDSLPDELVADIFRQTAIGRNSNEAEAYDMVQRSRFCLIQRKWHRTAALVLHSDVYISLANFLDDNHTEAEALFARCREAPDLAEATVRFSLQMCEEHEEDDRVSFHELQYTMAAQ